MSKKTKKQNTPTKKKKITHPDDYFACLLGFGYSAKKAMEMVERKYNKSAPGRER